MNVRATSSVLRFLPNIYVNEVAIEYMFHFDVQYDFGTCTGYASIWPRGQAGGVGGRESDVKNGLFYAGNGYGAGGIGYTESALKD